MHQKSTIEALREFSRERNWGQFHTPENLAKSISIEAGELLECFQWQEPRNFDEVRLELADVLTYAYYLADALGESPDDLMMEKLAITRSNYPVDKSFGNAAKYDKLD
ncbi:nucleotide pyrophosphohydrolase [Corynebacterium glutamicum]|uniref:nucleotide pyrophosphohydrolase n=1 Tax=Corynebacterium glutamicum TaxID=1718 RepID=UPI0007449115|nr:nucleotide pyrophosphohydrolase [Corynebacterium glutamicum]ALZ99488.1 nucleotide pyrophosphohydrolase [Corynebacterium glutamicum]